MSDRPSLAPAAGAGCLAALAFALAGHLTPAWWARPAEAAGAILGLYGLLVLADWLASRALAHAERLRWLLPEELEPEPAAPVEVEVRPSGNGGGPLIYVLAGPERVPLSFAAELLQSVEGDALPAVRRWGEGSAERAWAGALVGLLVERGHAEPARGNRPARLKRPVSEVATALGLADP